MYRNPLPRFSWTSKEESLTTPIAPSPRCPGLGGTARGTHLMSRYSTESSTLWFLRRLQLWKETKCIALLRMSIFPEKWEKDSKEGCPVITNHCSSPMKASWSPDQSLPLILLPPGCLSPIQPAITWTWISAHWAPNSAGAHRSRPATTAQVIPSNPTR